MTWDLVWENIFCSQEWGRYPAESLVRFIARNFYKKDRKNVSLLEIGCGPGANIWYMAREGFNVCGIDGSRTAIKKAKQRIEKNGLKASLQVGDVVDLPYEDSRFDAIVDNECIYSNSIEDAKKILLEVKRVLKNYGLFFSRTFSNEMYIGNTQERVGYLEYRNISDGPLKGNMISRLITRGGIHKLYGKFFKIISVDKIRYTDNNGSIVVSEWIIICQKRA